MEQELSSGVKMLNGFLKLMIFCLVAILIAIPLAAIGEMIGFFD